MGEAGVLPRLKSKVEKKTGRLVGKVRRLLGLEYCCSLSEAALFDMLRGKSVAVVGNARSLLEKDFGPSIDAFDVVIRCNAAPIPNVRSHGQKTTAIATSIELEKQIMSEKGASHLLWMSPPRNALPGWMLKWPDFFLYPKENHRRLIERIGGGRPTTGLMVVDLLSCSPCRQVALYGFDFFKSQSLSSDRTREAAPHQFDAEEDYINELIRSDSRFSLNR